MMRDDHRKLRSLPARPIEQLIDALKSATADELRGVADASPRVTLHLTSGHGLSGTVIGIAETRYGNTVLVQTGGDRPHNPGSDATYVSFASIEAITIHDATDWVELLAGGSVRTIDLPPTRLGAKRAIDIDRENASKTVARTLSWTVKLDDAPDGEPIRLLAAMSAALLAVFEAIVKDELGREALGKVSGVAFEAGDAFSVRLVDGTLHVRGSEQDLKTLRRAVEAAL